MSALAGIRHLDGRPGVAKAIARMLEPVAHRGPHGSGTWRDGEVALGHRLLLTTPESRLERLPLANRAGDVILTADARLDNREEVHAALGGSHAPQATDAELILAAYERWGDAFCERLVGDFAVAIWDARRGVFVCARDHMGVKPFYYHASRALFAFGSEIKQLLALRDVPRRLEETRVGDYLAGVMDEEVSTFYRDVSRLPAAHRLIAGREGVRLERYWALDPMREVRCASDAEYAEGFRTHFAEAVRCRLRAASPVGAMLSGGLDSSSIVCTARQLLDGRSALHTFSAVFPDLPASDERQFIDRVLAGGGVEPHFVTGEELRVFGDLAAMLHHEDEPFYTPNLFVVWALYASARRHGIGVMLDGVDGDSTVSHGTRYLTELAVAGRWEEFASEAKALSVGKKVRPEHYLRTQGFPSVTARARAGDVRAVAAAARQIGRHFGLSRWGVLRDCVVRPLAVAPVARRWRSLRPRVANGGPPAGVAAASFMRPEFARRVNLADRHAAMWGHRYDLMRTSREDHMRRLSGGLLRFVLEVLDRVAAAFSIEPRYPFCDKRLVEFCLGLPADQKLRRGWTRWVLRDAMAGILPHEIRWRPDKGDLSANFHRALARERGRLEAELFDGAGLLGHYIDMPAVRRALDDALVAGNNASAVAVWKVATLSAWLRRAGPTVR